MNIDDEIIKMADQAKRTSVPAGRASNLYADLAFDSLSFIELLLKIEDTYSISFDLTEMEGCLEIERLIFLVEKKVKERSSHD